MIIPYISDREGQFKRDFNQDSELFLSELYISFKWKDGIHILDLQRSVLSPQTASLEWNEDNVTIASQLYNTQSYQGTVLGDKESLVALSISDGLVRINYRYINGINVGQKYYIHVLVIYMYYVYCTLFEGEQLL